MKKLLILFLGILSIINVQTVLANDSTVVKTTLPVDDIKLPPGFKATIVAGKLGRARHLVVNTNGDIYVKLERLRNGKGIVRLRDTNGDGKADDSMYFGNYVGTGITIKNGYLYASSNSEVFRYKLNEKNEVANPDAPEKIITGLVDQRTHNSKSIVLDNDGNIYVNIGAPTNACQVQDRTKGSPGQEPCPILEKAGGIWQFKADGKNQSYGEGVRFATGLRNVVGLDWNGQTNSLFVMQHGRDQLSNLYPEMFNDQQSAELPAEEMFELKKGADCGWPYCYYDQQQNKKVLAPEYGGDGKQVGRCEGVTKPVVAFPGHLAPNGLLFYTGSLFPEKYKNGAFIAFHGSWNRAPLPQKGFFVAFVPFKDGKPSGEWEIFADNFAGMENISSPGQAEYRPCGLSQGPDGALYVSEDAKGTIWKITYKP
ncbi:PQQ-dependent sugar dehydrogenase [Chitinophagaceae bacterium LB-8]|uniref:PQQ-dependent sugar dehydrogenase n=1 Tax=Paraflavisolibacter caeni TaxID=2982496 RepID=A0A9X3B767_9BACT|nr:PQQ-dependent sugar dehydrogenase [Paraflavisolibacter caeni]MCU7548885.1 PQQ-dependent sugar dehydrogenase [Paraflavisolibacter caeni]